MKLNYLTITTAVNIPYTDLKGVEESVVYEKYFNTAEEAIEFAKAFKKVNRDFEVLNASYNMSIFI